MKGKTTVAAVLVMALAACGDNGDTVAKQAGEKVGSLVTEFAEGAGKGIDQKMQVDVELSDDFKTAGISRSVAKQDNLAERSVVIYFIAEKAFKGQMVMKAYNEAGQEIGRATSDVEFGVDDAKYVTFTFDMEMDTQLVKSYKASLRAAG